MYNRMVTYNQDNAEQRQLKSKHTYQKLPCMLQTGEASAHYNIGTCCQQDSLTAPTGMKHQLIAIIEHIVNKIP